MQRTHRGDQPDALARSREPRRPRAGPLRRIRPVQPRDSLRAGPRRCGQSGLFRQSSAISRSLRISPPRIVLAHDPGHVLDLDPSVPDPLRIDHHGRAVLALLQAAGMIGTCQRPEAGRLQLLLERLAERLAAFRVATAPLVAGVTDIAADENMVGKRWHVRPSIPIASAVLRPSRTRLSTDPTGSTRASRLAPA